MIRLRVRELAEARNYNMATFQRAARLPMSNVRRLWFSTSDGLENGPPLKSAWFDILEDLADFFGVEFCDLFEKIPDK